MYQTEHLLSSYLFTHHNRRFLPRKIEGFVSTTVAQLT